MSTLFSDSQEFAGSLRDGDILLFDKLASLNRLVQWGDNRPVGHCGVWYAGGVYEATIKPAAPGAAEGGVFHTPFKELLDLRVHDDRGGDIALIRTITAMRHPEIDADQVHAVLSFLKERVGSSDFSVQEMLLLTPFAVERSFSGRPESPDDVLRAVIRLCRLYAGRSLRGLADPQRMFCSQLVYRAFEQAGVQIEIRDPLVDRYHGRRGSQQESTTETDLLLRDYEREFFESKVPEVATGELIPGGGGDEGFFLNSAGRAPERADMVTPGDFWCSPSLQASAVFHRPPDAI